MDKYIKQAHEAFVAADNKTSLEYIFSLANATTHTGKVLTGKICGRLRRHGINTVGDLRALRDSEISKIRGIGYASTDLIYQIKHGESDPNASVMKSVNPLLKRLIAMIGEAQVERILLASLPREDLVKLVTDVRNTDELIAIIQNDSVAEEITEQ